MRRAPVYLGATALIAGMVAVALPATAGKPPAPSTPVVDLEKTGYSINENGGALAVRIVRNTNTCAKGSRVHVTSFNGSAVAPDDYTAFNADVSIPPCSTSQIFNIPITNDNVAETQQKFTLQLTGVNQGDSDYAQVGKKKTATITISDDDPLPAVSVADNSAAEGSPVQLVVSLSAPPGVLPVSVNYSTSSGSATSGADFTPTSGNFVWGSGDGTTRTINVPTATGDGDEPAETFNVTLSGLVNASALDLNGVGTITDTDAAPTISVGDATVTEGGNLSFPVTLSGVTASAITVPWSTSGVGSATAYNVGDSRNDCASADADNDGTDFVGSNTFTVVFPAGSSGPQSISVPTCTDDDSEIDETLLAELGTPTYGTVNDGVAVGVIDDNDVPTATISTNPTVDEGDNAVYTVVLSGPQSHAVTVTIEADQTFSQAQPPGDHSSLAPVVLNFAAGDVSEDFTVATLVDGVPEAPEILWAEILSATGATVPAFTSNLALDDGWSLGTINSADAVEVEPNNWFGAANPVTGVMYGTIEAGGANDWYSFVAGPTGNVTISTGPGLTDSCALPEADPVVELFATDGVTSLGINDDGGTFLCDLLAVGGLTPGATYFVRVGNAIFFNLGSPGDDYALTVVSP